jgi:hypothetical protein
MSAYGLHPKFKDEAGYKAWRRVWRRIYARLTHEIRAEKRAAKAAQRGSGPGRIQAELLHKRVMAAKAMTLLKDAKVRWARIQAMKEQMDAQQARLPLDLGVCQKVDFHYNRGHSSFPSILPVWVVKAKGETFYLEHLEGSVRFETREMESGATKGMLRFRKCQLTIREDRTAVLTQA